MEIPTREQYENKINEFKDRMSKAQQDSDYWAFKQQGDMQSRCAGMDSYCGGMSCCDRWKMNATKANTAKIKEASARKEKAKVELWDYQKDVAKAEQDAQVEAVRQAIADQVRLEQERIQQSQQNQKIMQEAPPAEPEPSAMSEKITPMSEKITPMSEKITPYELPFHYNYLIPIIAIGGYLVLRN